MAAYTSTYNLPSVLNNFNIKSCPGKYEHAFGGLSIVAVKHAQTRQKSSREVKKRPADAGKQRNFWKRTAQFASGRKAHRLVETVIPLSNVKEDVYGTLDELVAFETEFPIIALGKALQRLRKLEQWQRIIQVSKWMLSKGQGKTMGTYDLMLNAYDMDARLDDAEALWERLLAIHGRSVPKKLFARMMSVYKRRSMPEELLKVFNQMQELRIKPDEGTVKRVRIAYKELGMTEEEKKLTEKYASTWKYYSFKGKTIRVRARQLNNFPRPDDTPDSVDTSGE